MTFGERARAAQNQRDATYMLADGIDAILRALDERKESAWTDEWTQSMLPADQVREQFGLPSPDQTLAIGQLEEQLRTTTDPDTARALSAKLALLRDKGQALDIEPPGDEYGADADGVVHVPPADPTRQAERRAWALSARLGSDFLRMDDQEAADGFAKGGPVWLYYGNREAVMQMPDQWRKMLVLDVERDSVKLAKSMGRDILKDVSAGTPSVTMESLASELEANRG